MPEGLPGGPGSQGPWGRGLIGSYKQGGASFPSAHSMCKGPGQAGSLVSVKAGDVGWEEAAVEEWLGGRQA